MSENIDIEKTVVIGRIPAEVELTIHKRGGKVIAASGVVRIDFHSAAVSAGLSTGGAMLFAVALTNIREAVSSVTINEGNAA